MYFLYPSGYVRRDIINFFYSIIQLIHKFTIYHSRIILSLPGLIYMKGLTMEYLEFLECVRAEVEKLCESEEEVVLKRITKNNSLNLDCVMIHKPDTVVTPTIYLNSYFDDYLSGKSIKEISEEILAADNNARGNFSFDVKNFDDFDIMKSRIACKIINRDRNLSMLKEVPHREYLDLAVVYYFYLESSESGYATTIINNSYLDLWKLDEETLYEMAVNNTPVIMKPVIKSMEDILGELILNEFYSDDERDNMYDDIHNLNNSAPQMFVITNEAGIFGAAGILNKDLLENFGKMYGSFFILPSSIHELIFIPDDNMIDKKELEKMVREVNITQVNYDEYLSDYVYYYDTDCISVAKLN